MTDATGPSQPQDRSAQAPRPLVTVVVPFHDATDHLPGLVAALARQEASEDIAWEVLFVNDGSTDDGPAALDRALAAVDLDARVLDRVGSHGSSYAARNVGVQAARGQLLAFTDADCRPSPTWLAAIVAHLADAGRTRDVVAGAVDLELVDPTNPWELFDHAVHMDNEASAAAGRVATANMAVRRAAFDEVGLFREVSSGGDHDWSRRASSRGWNVEFDPEVRVSHPTRRTRADVMEKVVRTSRGQGEMAAAALGSASGLAARALLRPLLVHRHLRVAATPSAAGGPRLRARLLGVSVAVRMRQVPAFVSGWRRARRARDHGHA